ncbi:ATP-dependent zinc metalloprotease FtsH [Polystyrenella longa]|uniref:ATP-dependent zinc metalloprotease FtsH n=1 Tax=Polystyrenella longa TaxID=2528007 RepID=A0A518CN15_9PLAN|nr:ATP-dependent zinc metalloprotease FtsH [Polystyrenella longa]QDU80603.1 ATP-dependent zinc metalloprotease FtsH [Polystyrenella longa]
MDSPSSKPEPSKKQKSEKSQGNSGEKKKRPAPGFPGGIWFILLIMLAVMFLFNMGGTKDVEYSFVREQAEQGNVEEIIYNPPNTIYGKWVEPPTDPEDKDKKLSEDFTSYVYDTESLFQFVKTLTEEKKLKSYKALPFDSGAGQQLLIYFLMSVFFLGIIFFIFRRNSESMGQGMFGNFAKSPAKRFTKSDKQQTFNDVAGMEQAKLELEEVVEFLKNPEKFRKIGAEIPRGVLLKGSPGTGKTLLARATAGEAGVPFFSVSGSEFIQMFVGVGASRVRDLFKTAKENAPCIIFIDEIDAVGRERGAGLGGGHDEREQTLNQILSEMDGFEKNEAAIVIAATNRPDVLDPALLRPGRFDRHVTVDKPSKEGRVGILKVHTRSIPLDSSVDLENIAANTIGFSGAELKNLVNEAAIHAARASRKVVMMEDFDSARDKVLMGPPRENILQGHERDMTAYHEAGHALIAWLEPEVDSVHKVTIIPRGWSLGLTQLVPDEENFSIGENKLHAQLAMIMGGRAAEKLIFDEYTAGAQSDLKKATQIARRMVANWGMSEKIGPVAFDQREVHPFLGKEMHDSREYSEQTAHLVDTEIQSILINAANRATELLTENREALTKLAEALLDKESLGYAELTELIGESAQAKKRNGNGKGSSNF